MKFASWNIARRDGGVAALVEHLNPDIAFLQECKRPELLEVPGYQVVGKSINERGRKQDWGNAVISKFPLYPVEIVSEYSGSLVCAFAVLPDGKTLGLVNIYGLLESSPMKPEVKVVHYGIHRMLSDVGFWLAQLEEPKVDGFIVGGDLNKDRKMDGGTGFKTGRSIASNLLNRFSDFGLVEADLDGARTFTHSSSKSTWQIDHIFLSEHLAKRTTARVVTTNGINEHSDHSPIELSVDGALGG